MQITISNIAYYGFGTVNAGGYFSFKQINNTDDTVTMTNAIDGKPSDTITVTYNTTYNDSIMDMYIWKLW